MPALASRGCAPTRHQTDMGKAELREALRQHGQRYTLQRAAVHSFLSQVRSHPTADEVFLAVRQELPGISLATVYNSLEALVGCGLATRLAFSDGSARYDGQVDPHLHARCSTCGRVVDVYGSSEASILEAVPPAPEAFQVDGIRVELTGLCRDCQDQPG